MGLIGFCFEIEEVSAAGPTYVSGIISSDTTWTEANSPYIVTGNVLVEENVNLTIQPGVTVKFNKNLYLKIEGTFNAIGMESKMINFTSKETTPKRGDWGELTFTEKSERSIFNYCIIEYSESVMHNACPDIIINNCIIRNNYHGINIENGNQRSQVINNLFSNNYWGIDIKNSNDEVIIKNNTFINNSEWGIILTSIHGTISNNYFFNNGQLFRKDFGAISTNRNFNQTYIINNKIINNSVGIKTFNSLDVIFNNLIKENDFGINVDSFYGSMYQNNISNNYVGISIIDTKQGSIKNNNIIQNSNNSVVVENAKDVDLKSNWWGTNSSGEIDNGIFDYYDDFELGKVIYKPYLQSPVIIYFNGTNHRPIANAGLNLNAKINQNIKFDASNSSDPDGDPLLYKWRFNNTSTEWLIKSETSHNYSEPGYYLVTLTVFDGILTDKDVCIVNVTGQINQPPIANAGSDQEVKVGETIYFNGSKSYDPDNDTLTYKWDFDDGNSTSWSNSSKTTHSFTKEGKYNVTLEVFDGKDSSTDFCFIDVKNASVGPVNRTEVSGIISKDTTWTEANNPYIVTGNILVKENVNLTIQPGVTVKFKRDIYMKIEGTLFAVGTTKKMITFTGSLISSTNNTLNPGHWKGFELTERSKESIFKFCIVEYSMKAFDGESENIDIIHCIIRNNNNLHGELKNGNYRILNNIFIDNRVGIRLKYSKSEILIINNTFKNNYDWGVIIEGAPCKINNNRFINNGANSYDGGINCMSDEAQISNNVVIHNNIGISCSDEDGNISYNLIQNNNEGLYLKAFYGSIWYNNITNNSYGFRIRNHGYGYPMNATIKHNNIYQNINNSVYMHYIKDVNFQNNWWGTTDTDLINQSIYDYFDDFEKGKVIYKPYLTSPVDISFESPPNNASNTNQTNNRAPVFTSTPTKEATVGVEWLYIPEATDPDNDEVVFLPYIVAPVGMYIHNGTIRWIPKESQVGNNKVRIMATDGNYDVYQEFTIFVKNKTQPQNETQPKIAESNIPNGSTNVSINNSQIKIIFSKAMNRSTVEAALKISPSANYTMYWGKGDTELIIVFNKPLSAETEYSVTIDTTAKDAWGNYLKAPFELNFTTEKASKKTINGDDFFADNFSLIVIIIVLLVIILIMFLTFILGKRQRIRNKDVETDIHDGRYEMRGGVIAEDYYKDESAELVNNLIKDALKTKKPSDFSVNQQEMLNKVKIKYRSGKISKETYNLIENKLTK
jgi:parallel beta-helix repeat protein